MDQEQANVRHWLRDQRQVAFARLLERADGVTDSLGPIITARASPDWVEVADHRELWAPANEALNVLERSVAAVAILGPDNVATFAKTIYGSTLAKANTMRFPDHGFDDRVMRFAEAVTDLEQARTGFIEAARRVLSSVDS
jgi:hypothetical protein